MPKSNRKHRRRMNGGMWPFDSGTSSSPGYGSSSSGSGSMFGNLFGTSSGTSGSGSMFGNWFGTKKNTGYGSSNTGYGSSNTGYGSSNTGYGTNVGYGGKTRKHRMRGGFKDNTPTTGLAVHAASFSGKTAQPHTLVGGRTRRHRHYKSCSKRCNKSCKNRH